MFEICQWTEYVTLKPFKEDGLSHCKRIADGLSFKMDNSLGLDGAKKFEV